MKVTATKEFKWDCAHVLAGHEGACQNLHGHTYLMEVTVGATDGGVIPTGASAGMVMDFKDLKDIVNEQIVDKYDHALVVNVDSSDEFEKALYHLARKHDKKLVEIDYRPTAEQMAVHFLRELNNLALSENALWEITRIRLWETPTSYAEVTND